MMAKGFQTWVKIPGIMAKYQNVRGAKKRVRIRLPVQTFIEKEASVIFGPARNLDGTPIDEEKKFSKHTRRTDSRFHSSEASSTQASQASEILGTKSTSIIRELDSILTFPMSKTYTFEEEKELIPSVSADTDIPVLNSDKVLSLDRKASLPSVSKVLEKSRPPESQALLDRWKEKMIRELGEEGFALWQKETFARGNNLHSCIQKQLETGDGATDLDEKNSPFWQSMENVFGDVSDVHLIEQYCKHPHLRYHGYFDCIARYRDKLCLIEWKTSKRRKATLDSTFDNPLQIVAYMGAVDFAEEYDVKGPVAGNILGHRGTPTFIFYNMGLRSACAHGEIDSGLLVVAYENGRPADVHSLDSNQCALYWGSWLHRLYTYWRLTLQEQEDLKGFATAT